MITGLGKLTQRNGGGGRIACIKELGVSEAEHRKKETLTVDVSQGDESSSMSLKHNPRWILHIRATRTFREYNLSPMKTFRFSS